MSEEASPPPPIPVPPTLSDRCPSDQPHPNELVIPVSNVRLAEGVDDRGVTGLDVSFDLMEDVFRMLPPNLHDRFREALAGVAVGKEPECKKGKMHVEVAADTSVDLKRLLKDAMKAIELTATSGKPCKCEPPQ